MNQEKTILLNTGNGIIPIEINVRSNPINNMTTFAVLIICAFGLLAHFMPKR